MRQYAAWGSYTHLEKVSTPDATPIRSAWGGGEGRKGGARTLHALHASRGQPRGCAVRNLPSRDLAIEATDEEHEKRTPCSP